MFHLYFHLSSWLSSVCLRLHVSSLFYVLSVNGYWQPWQDWKHCNVSCGGGTQVRERVCVEPLHGGETCPGPSEEITDCNTHPCPGVSCVSDDTMALQHPYTLHYI